MDLKKLLTAGSIRTFVSDEIVFNDGDPGEEMFVILSGSCEVFMTSIDGFPVSIAQLGPGDFFGEMSLLEGVPRCASVRAIEETKVIVVDKDNFKEVFYNEPQLAYRIMKGLSSRLRKQNERIRKFKSRGEVQLQQNNGDNPIGEAYISSLTGILQLPPGHKEYSIVAPHNHEEFMFYKKIQCPVCGETFDAETVRSTRLRLQQIEPDFRQRFFDFEPLWYLIWVCPGCYYSNFNYQFNQVPSDRKKLLQEKCTSLKKKLYFAFTNPRDMDQVFIAYYLALECITSIRPDSEQLGRIWLRLSWLYEDASDPEMFQLATGKALDYFEKTRSYRNGLLNSFEQSQRLHILLGELYLKKGLTEQALENFRKAILHERGNRSLNRQANDRILELKNNENHG